MAYHQYPPQGYHHPQQQPPQHAAYYQSPADAFRSFFVSRLAELTFNSRPIISSLTTVASREKDLGQWDNVNVIVRELADAIYRAPPHQKLPLLYLLDSISKLCGEPYTTHYLPDILPDLFLSAYQAVDGVTRAKMEEILRTWAADGYNRPELYPRGVREAVERGIYGQPQQQPPPAMLPAQPQQTYPSHDQVKSALHSTLQAKQRAVALNPADREAATQINVLLQINSLLDRGAVSPPERAQILDQMREMNPPAPSAPPPQIAAQTLAPFGPAVLQGRSPLPSAIPTPPQAPAIPGMDIGNILNSLNKLKSTGFIGSPRIGTPESISNDLPSIEVAKPSASQQNGLEAYEELILGLNVQLTLADLNKSQQSLPYAHLPKRCAICAFRFPEGKDGAAALADHMDWHYRRNNQQNSNAGRGGYRRWLPKADDWVNDLTASYSHNAEAGPSNSNPNTTAGRAAAKALADKQRAENMKKRVKIPESQAGKDVLCPICKDKLEKEWSNDAEGFVWINAVKGNGQVMHATCAAEARAALSARQLSDKTRGTSNSPAPGSRQSTPQPSTRPAIGESPLKPTAVKLEPSGSGDGEPALESGMDEGATGGIKRKAGELEEGDDAIVKKERV